MNSSLRIRICLAAGIAAVSLWAVGAVHAQFPAFPPDDVTAVMDRDQMLWQLGIEFPDKPDKIDDPMAPPGARPADPANPDGNWTDDRNNTITRSNFGLWSNYDDVPGGFFPGPEAWRAGDYTPIDLLVMNDGSRITTEAEWWSKRRPELFRDVQEQLWGVLPSEDVLPEVTWTVEQSTGEADGVAYIEKTITGTIDISRYPEVRNRPEIQSVVRIPADADGPVPVLITFGGGRGGVPNWTESSSLGWGSGTFNPNSVQPDNGAGLTSYLIGLVNQGNWRDPDDWGSLVAWAWGISRLIDYFETDEDIDAAQVALTGHSRYGKATIVAMAFDQRVAIGFPSCGGSLGPKLNRRHWGQNLENSAWDREYHWVAGNFFKWMGPLNEGEYMPRRVELCPVDGHSLIALCAPRPVFLNGGTTDSWSDPYGTYLAGVGATPVYELLGKRGVIMNDETPQIDVGYLEGDLAYRCHEGGHTPAPDFPAFFEFASRYLSAP